MPSLSFLMALDPTSLILLFWFAVIFELPRYTIGALVIGAGTLFHRDPKWADPGLSVSVLLVGHNEAGVLRRCVTALADQTIAQTKGRMQVVVVDDGSTDGMSTIAQALLAERLVDQTLRLQVRGGKSAGVNLGLTVCHGDVVVISDIDTTFDRDAIERMLPAFADKRVGAVGGDLGVRNADASLVARHQAIEYLIAITLGRRISGLLGTLSIVSGAFGAFRRVAIEQVGGQDVEVGEDADLTMKLRRAGWQIRFVPQARALTQVPESVVALIAQRLRWDKGVVTIWLRKFRGMLDPRVATFRATDLVAMLDVLLFQLVLTLIYPVYIIWLYHYVGAFSVTILGAVMLGYVVLDLVMFAAAVAVSHDTLGALRLLPYLPLYTFLQISLMRVVRLIAIFEELVWRSSYRDPYVPARVMRQVDQI